MEAEFSQSSYQDKRGGKHTNLLMYHASINARKWVVLFFLIAKRKKGITLFLKVVFLSSKSRATTKGMRLKAFIIFLFSSHLISATKQSRCDADPQKNGVYNSRETGCRAQNKNSNKERRVCKYLQSTKKKPGTKEPKISGAGQSHKR